MCFTFTVCSWVSQETNVSMIITDYWMPEMTGYELLKKVKVIHHTASFLFLPKIT